MFSWNGILIPPALVFYLLIILDERRFPASLETLFGFSGLFLVLLKCKVMVDPLFSFIFNKSEYYDAIISMGPDKSYTMVYSNLIGWVFTLFGISKIVKNYLSE